ncbi:ribonuclease III [European chub iridovirus]|nr:ribonuclease III [European chub iridovirus]
MEAAWCSFVVDYLLVKCCEMDATFAHKIFKNNYNLYKSAFVSAKTNSVCNYEYLEMIGDGVIGMALPLYLNERFPVLRERTNALRVRTLARLKLMYLSGTRMSTIASKLGFLRWIKQFNCLQHMSYQEQQKLLEDCFEAFCGALVITFDAATGVMCSGQIVCYRFLRYAYGLIHISLDNLVDNKTMLKEIVDTHRADLKSFAFTYEKSVMTCKVGDGKYVTQDTNKNGMSKKEMEKIVAGHMLALLAKNGYIHSGDK